MTETQVKDLLERLGKEGGPKRRKPSKGWPRILREWLLATAPPASLSSPPSPAALAAFERLLLTTRLYPPTTRRALERDLERLEAHGAYAERVAQRAATLAADGKHLQALARGGALGARTRDAYLLRREVGGWEEEGESLTTLVRARLTLERARAFCFNIHTGRADRGRLSTLAACGWEQEDQNLKAWADEVDEVQAGWEQLPPEERPKGATATHFHQLHQHAGFPLTAQALGERSLDELERLVLTAPLPRKRLAFQLVRAVLGAGSGGAPETLTELVARLPRAATGLTVAEAFIEGDEWRAALVESLTAQHRARVEHSSAYAEKRLKHAVLSDLRFLAFVRSRHAARGLRAWLAEDADEPALRAELVAWGRAARPRNEQVRRSGAHLHHAHARVAAAVTLLRSGVAGALGERGRAGAAGASLRPEAILTDVPNLRVPAPADERRVYTDEEVAAMFTVVADDARFTALLVVLREVGLRVGALTALRYPALVDPATHEPRERCAVLEKNRCFRHFVASQRLRDALVRLVAELRADEACAAALARDPADVYLFGVGPGARAKPDSTIRTTLQAVAKRAGVRPRMYPHAFRHTLVGKLLKAGNSAELVSKFMGHASPAVTTRSYWVESAAEVARQVGHLAGGGGERLLESKAETARLLVAKYREVLAAFTKEEGVALAPLPGTA